jgi:predicted nucleic acid-binding protein
LILADTSVWIDHLRKDEPALVALLNSGQVVTHPYIVGELALGNLRQRKAILGAMQNLPQATVARDDEALAMIDRWALYGRGIGYVDAHLLASVPLSPGALLWTRDQRLRTVAVALSLHASLK